MRKPMIWLLVLGAGLLVSPAFAQFFQNWWHVTPFDQFNSMDKDSSGIPVRQGSFVEWQRSLAPGFRGEWFFTWSATPYGQRGLYCGKIRANGDTAWFKTVNDGPDRQEDPVIMGTADGGAIIAWVDFRNGPYLGDSTLWGDQGGSIFCQKLDSNGTRLWPIGIAANDSVHAIPVCMTTSVQIDIRLIDDGASGCFIFWEDSRNNLGQDIYGKRILSNGTTAPGFRVNGNPVVVSGGNQPANSEYTVDVDGHNGAWIAWTDNRNLNPDIYIQQMHGNGTTRWDSTGHPFDVSSGEQTKIKLAPDGRGGAFMIWRNATGTTVNLYMERIDSTGTKMWAPDSGVAIGTWINEQTNPRIVYSSPDTCIVNWEDFRNDPVGTQNEDIFAQKISGTTSMLRLWDTNGVAVCTEASHQRESRLCADGTGGCVIVWEDERNPGAAAPFPDEYAQRVNRAGSCVWDANGRAVAPFPGGQTLGVCRESSGHLLFMWSDAKLGSLPIYRTVWDLNGNVVGSVAANGTLTVPDISGNVTHNTIVKQGSTRVINFWVDGRRAEFGNRIYYYQNSILIGTHGGAPVTPVKNGIPITIDSTNVITQDGTLLNSTPLTVETPDSGAIVVYFNTLNGSQTLRAQKISYTGAQVWGPYGVEVCSPVIGPDYLTGVPDGNGGVYFAHTIAGAAPTYLNEVHLQHINSSGNTLLSATGVAIQPGHEQQGPYLTMSGGNIYVGYAEVYDMDYNLYRIRLLKLSTNGGIIWARTLATGQDSSGTTGPTGYRSQVRLIPGTNGSVVVYWMEFRYEVAGGSGAQIYAQKVNADSTLAWGANGIRLGISAQSESDARGVQAGTTYWFSWKDTRNYGYSSIYVQHLSETGAFILDTNGMQVHASGNAQAEQYIIPADATTGVYLAYEQFTNGLNPFPPPDTLTDADVIATHLFNDGSVVRPSVWRPVPYAGYSDQVAYVVKMPQQQHNPQGVAMYGGGIYNWLDLRSTGKEELVGLYVQRIRDDDSLAVREIKAPLPKMFSLQQNYPNPFNSTTVIRFALPQTERIKIAIYDVLGREVAKLVDDVKMTGTYEVRWYSTNKDGMKVSSGVYFYRMTTPQGSITKKMTLLN